MEDTGILDTWNESRRQISKGREEYVPTLIPNVRGVSLTLIEILKTKLCCSLEVLNTLWLFRTGVVLLGLGKFLFLLTFSKSSDSY